MIDLDDIKGVKFCHYTTFDNARKIISGERLFLSKFEDTNDLLEKEENINDDKVTFLTCFCHSEAKSIPMFYLYSGIDGKGCRLEFTAAKIKEILRNIEVYPVNSKNICLKKEISREEYDVKFDWIHYIAKDGFEYYKGRGCQKYRSIEEAKKQNPDIHNFNKTPIWRYENEFRIIVQMIKPCKYEKVAIRIPCKEYERGISITYGPELGVEDTPKIQKEFKDYGIQNVNPFSEEKIIVSMQLINKNKVLLSKG